MDARPAPTLSDAIAAAQEWWREAGVDMDFTDEPQSWLKPDEADAPPAPATPVRAPAPPPPPKIGGEPQGWPQDPAAFRRWWMEEPSLDCGGTGPRIPARGEPGAPLMVVVPMPEEADGETLLSGPEGRLVASLALAMGHAPDAIYLASALPRYMVLPDWAGLAQRGLGDVLRHHIQLAAPKRVIVLGRGILPLLGHDPAQAAPLPDKIAIQAGSLPLLVSLAPGNLLLNAGQRASLWQRWLDWTDGDGG